MIGSTRLFRNAGILFISLLMSSSVFAGWSTKTMGVNSTHIYMPTTAPALNGKRALIINLHGCGQSNTELRDGAGWEKPADKYGAVVAIPNVKNGVIIGCWDYGSSTTTNFTRNHPHVSQMIKLIEAFKADGSYNIDPGQIYITGISSGGSEAMVVGCVAPDLIAGVGNAAGPAIGSAQGPLGALDRTSAQISADCQRVAGANANDLKTQLYAGINGSSDFLANPQWSERIGEGMRSLYGANAFKNMGAIERGTLSLASDAQGPRVSKIYVNGMGHGWPGAADNNRGGSYVLHGWVDFTAYVTDFFFENNRRVAAASNAPPVVSISVSVSGATVFVSGSATDDGQVSNTKIELKPVNSASALNTLNVGGASSFAESFGNVPDGLYEVRAQSTDNEGLAGNVATQSIEVSTGGTNQPPVISLIGPNPMSVTVGDSFLDPGATASDSEDGNLSSQIVRDCNVDTNVIGSYVCNYSVTDSDGLSATISRAVNVSDGVVVNTPPQIQLVGSSSMTINQGAAFSDPGATASDNEDGNLSAMIAASCNVNTSQAGSYACQYSVTDSGGLSASATRSVTVTAVQPTCKDYTAFLLAHRSANRVYSAGWFGTAAYYAVGSDEKLTGQWWELHTVHTFDGAVFHAGACP